MHKCCLFYFFFKYLPLPVYPHYWGLIMKKSDCVNILWKYQQQQYHNSITILFQYEYWDIWSKILEYLILSHSRSHYEDSLKRFTNFEIYILCIYIKNIAILFSGHITQQVIPNFWTVVYVLRHTQLLSVYKPCNSPLNPEYTCLFSPSFCPVLFSLWPFSSWCPLPTSSLLPVPSQGTIHAARVVASLSTESPKY